MESKAKGTKIIGTTPSYNYSKNVPKEPEKLSISNEFNSTEARPNPENRKHKAGKDCKTALRQEWKRFEGLYGEEIEEKNLTKEFLIEIAKLLASYLMSQTKPGSKVLDFHHPHQLKEILSHCLGVEEKARDMEQILSDCKETLKYCVKTGHPHFLNQLSTGVDIVGVAGEWLTAAVNTNMFTYEISPVFILMEDVVLSHMRSFIGWEEKGDGIFTPGGTISNMYSLMLARHQKFPSIKENGMQFHPKMFIFTSEQSHFSIDKAAIILGIGSNNVCNIPCDPRGKMDAKCLEKEIQRIVHEGHIPLMVNATCGTTVLGAYDPVDEIAVICSKYHIWLHVDGAWGGSALLSRKHRHLLKGVERADSMTWNPHKMMGAPLQCSAFLVRNKGVLQSANELKADYLYQQDKLYDVSYDTGDKAIQCGRHNDVFKLWLMWRAKGDEGFAEMVDRNFMLSRYLQRLIKEEKHFTPVLPQIEGPNVSFWYEPPQLHLNKLCPEERKLRLHEVAPKIKAAMMVKGNMMIAYQPLGTLPNFFRIAISNPKVTERDLDWVITEIVELSRDLF